MKPGLRPLLRGGWGMLGLAAMVATSRLPPPPESLKPIRHPAPPKPALPAQLPETRQQRRARERRDRKTKD